MRPAASSASGVATCAYHSVVVIRACPRISCTVRRCTPCSTRSDAAVWRASCCRASRTPARRHIAFHCRQSSERPTGLRSSISWHRGPRAGARCKSEWSRSSVSSNWSRNRPACPSVQDMTVDGFSPVRRQKCMWCKVAPGPSFGRAQLRAKTRSVRVRPAGSEPKSVTSERSRCRVVARSDAAETASSTLSPNEAASCPCRCVARARACTVTAAAHPGDPERLSAAEVWACSIDLAGLSERSASARCSSNSARSNPNRPGASSAGRWSVPPASSRPTASPWTGRCGTGTRPGAHRATREVTATSSLEPGPPHQR